MPIEDGMCNCLGFGLKNLKDYKDLKGERWRVKADDVHQLWLWVSYQPCWADPTHTMQVFLRSAEVWLLHITELWRGGTQDPFVPPTNATSHG